jgi:anti-sigma regulatory factor (Ser/Thr protein kinase)
LGGAKRLVNQFDIQSCVGEGTRVTIVRWKIWCTFFRISHPSELGSARRHITELAQSLGLTATDVGNVALVVTEMSTNILKHALRGELIAQETARNQTNGIELLALDTGLGMANVAECLRDGYSTAGSSGIELGAVIQTSTLAEIFSLPGRGTAVFARLVGRQASQLQFKNNPSELPSQR